MSENWSSSWQYEVGYRKPPKHGQFQPGKSGNPKGRPRNSKGLRQLLNEALNKPRTVSDGGVSRTMLTKELIVHRLTTDAIKEETRATALLLKEANDARAWNSDDKDKNLMKIVFVDANRTEQ